MVCMFAYVWLNSLAICVEAGGQPATKWEEMDTLAWELNCEQRRAVAEKMFTVLSLHACVHMLF